MRKASIFIILLFFLAGCETWIYDDDLVGSWGAKYGSQFYMDEETYYNYSLDDLAVFVISSDGSFFVHWIVTKRENEYYRCEAQDGIIEYWFEGDENTMYRSSYSINGSIMTLFFEDKKVVVEKL